MPITMVEHETAWTTQGNPKSPLTGSVTVAGGDYIVLGGMTPDNAITLNAPTGDSLTFNQIQTVGPSAFCWVGVWVAYCPSTQTFTLEQTRSATDWMWGFNAFVVKGSRGVGASTTATGPAAPSVNLTPQQPNSAVFMFCADWNANDGASRAYLTNGGTFTEQTYDRDASNYTVYGGAHLNAGTAASKAFGLSTPSMKYSMVLVEMLASLAPPTIKPLFPTRPMGALMQL